LFVPETLLLLPLAMAWETGAEFKLQLIETDKELLPGLRLRHAHVIQARGNPCSTYRFRGTCCHEERPAALFIPVASPVTWTSCYSFSLLRLGVITDAHEAAAPRFDAA
jgi:hypothetical protein